MTIQPASLPLPAGRPPPDTDLGGGVGTDATTERLSREETIGAGLALGAALGLIVGPFVVDEAYLSTASDPSPGSSSAR